MCEHYIFVANDERERARLPILAYQNVTYLINLSIYL